MFHLSHIAPDQAEGKVKEAYSVFPDSVPVPDPLQLMSASPDLVKLQSEIIRHYMTQERLDLGLLSSIRYLAATRHEYAYCRNFNAQLLQMAGGLSEEELQAMAADPDKAPLEEEQKALLGFVLKVVTEPESVDAGDVEKLKSMGWTEKDIFEAAYHGASMVSAGILYKAFAK